MQAVKQRIVAAAHAVGRDPATVDLLAVSKTWPAEAVRDAARTGQKAFGENYVQEGVDKIAALADLNLEWHFIGPLQSNKTRLVASHFDWVHSLERIKVAERLSVQRPDNLAPLNVCLQVNVSAEMSKSGVAPDEVLALAREVVALRGLRLRGLMCIPEPDGGAVLLYERFARLRELLGELRAQGFDVDTLSMGMSDDLELAIEAGSTLVRVGSAIFGARNGVRR